MGAITGNKEIDKVVQQATGKTNQLKHKTELLLTPRYKDGIEPLSKEWNHNGRKLNDDGYVMHRIPIDHPFAEMGRRLNKNEVVILEHRLIMAEIMKRNLLWMEFVHHKNGIKSDNRKENLEVINSGQHSKEHSLGYQHGYKKGYEDGFQAGIYDARKPS